MGPKKRKANALSDSSKKSIPTEAEQQDKEHDDLTNKSGEEKNATLPAYWAKAPMCHIPVAHHFQADVPDVSEVLELQAYRDATEGSKWLGTRVWPLGDDDDQGGNNADDDGIGRGRPTTSCGCRAPGSEECVRLHVSEKRGELRLQLGSAFEAWRFDEMGENVAKSWDGNKERVFKIMVASDKGGGFLRSGTTLKLRKTEKEIISYYFNVLVLRRVCAMARRGDPVDSDDDSYVDKRRKTRAAQRAAASSKFLKPLR